MWNTSGQLGLMAKSPLLVFLAVYFLLIAQMLWAAPASAQMNFLTLSSGQPPPLNNVNLAVTNAGPGASASGLPPDVRSFSTVATMGDLAQVGNGAIANAIVGLRVRGDQAYVLMMSQLSFTVTNLQYRGVALDGQQDRGSFVRVTAGTPAGFGNANNAGATSISGALGGEGLQLSQVSIGGVNPSSSTLVAQGGPPLLPDTQNTQGNGMTMPTIPGMGTTGGTDTGNNSGGNSNNPNSNNPNNRVREGAVDIPVIFSFPTGFALGPVSGGSPGSFAVTLQFGVFPRP